MRLINLIRLLLLVALISALPVKSSAAIILSVTIAPPPLPIYEQPLCPGEGYIWTPGYWAYGDYGFFWVPGTWVLIPEPGFLWTPGYWGWADGVYIFHEGYWGPHVGFYGGIVYGFGYEGFGYEGGYWNRGAFFYNRSVSNVRNITNVYNKTVIVNNTTVNNVSYNGGAGGVTARPTPEEEAAQHERHLPPSRVQVQHLQTASTNQQLYESANHGKPPIAGTAKPADFRGHGVVKAKAAARAYMPPTARSVARPAISNTASRPVAPFHANDLPRTAGPTFSNTGNPKLDKKYQQEQQKLYARQEQERLKLQQKQEQEHRRMPVGSDNRRSQQVEQRHKQQTQQLQQRHTRELQTLQERQQQGNRNPRR
jgi:hypothetical protein